MTTGKGNCKEKVIRTLFALPLSAVVSQFRAIAQLHFGQTQRKVEPSLL